MEQWETELVLMSKTAQELLNQLVRQYRQLRRLYLIYLAASVLALVFFFVDKRVTLVILAAMLIYYLAMVRRRSSAYAGAFVHTCLQSTLERYLQNARHTPQSPLDEESLRQTRLIAVNRERGSIITQEGGTGTYHGRSVALSDAGFTHTFWMDGKQHHEFVIGAWVRMELDHDTGLDCRLIHPKVMMKASRDQAFAQMSDLSAVEGAPGWMRTEGWRVLCPRDNTLLPGNAFFSSLHTLVQHTQLPLAICIQGGTLHVYVTNRILGQKVSSRVAPGQALLTTDFFPELGKILKLSDTI